MQQWWVNLKLTPEKQSSQMFLWLLVHVHTCKEFLAKECLGACLSARCMTTRSLVFACYLNKNIFRSWEALNTCLNGLFFFCSVSGEIGIKITVQTNTAAKHNVSKPDPQTRADFLQCKWHLVRVHSYDYIHHISIKKFTLSKIQLSLHCPITFNLELTTPNCPSV